MSLSMQVLFDAGCHLGHQAQDWHPKMKPWVYGIQDGIHIFDLEKTLVQIEKAQERIQALKNHGQNFVIVATKKQAMEIVQNMVSKNDFLYIINRWPGGLLTNWEQVSKSIKRMNEIEIELIDNKKNKTKYERVLMEKELNRLKRLFGGLKKLKSKPDALFIIDGIKEKNAIREAIREEVEIIALIDSNTDPSVVDIPIPANDDAISSIRVIVEAILSPPMKMKAKKNDEVVPEEETIKDIKEKTKTISVKTEEASKKDKTKLKAKIKEKKVVKTQEIEKKEMAKKVVQSKKPKSTPQVEKPKK